MYGRGRGVFRTSSDVSFKYSAFMFIQIKNRYDSDRNLVKDFSIIVITDLIVIVCLVKSLCNIII